MRILIGSESFYPNVSGVSVTTLNLATYLVDKGHEVAVVAPSPHRHNYREQFRKGFVVWHIASMRNPFRKDLRTTVYPWRQIRAVLGSWCPSVVHLQDPAPISLTLQRAAKAQDLPIVVSHHFTLDYVLTYLDFLKPVHPILLKGMTSAFISFYNSSQHVICPSETQKAELLAAGLRTPVTAVSNGVNLSRFFASEHSEAIHKMFQLPDVPLVLYVGRIDPDKSIETLIDAIPLILSQHSAHFVLCGGGKQVSHFKRMVEKLGIGNHVTFVGPFDYQSPYLPQIYRAGSCFVIPSRIETQSIVTLEAMASGLPIVAADAGALPELVSNGDNGFLFDPGDPPDLARYICRVLDDTELRKRMGKRSVERAVRHEINTSLQQIEEIYCQVVQNASTKASIPG